MARGSALIAAAAWLAALAGSYVVEDFVCTAAASRADTAPADTVEAVVLVLNALLLLLTLAVGVVGGYVGRRNGEGPRSATTFLGYLGAGLSLLFGFGIVLIMANPLVLEACQ